MQLGQENNKQDSFICVKQSKAPLLTLRLENNIEGMNVKWSEMAKGALHTLKHKTIIITIKWVHMAIVGTIIAV